MLAHRLRRWANISPALGQRVGGACWDTVIAESHPVAGICGDCLAVPLRLSVSCIHNSGAAERALIRNLFIETNVCEVNISFCYTVSANEYHIQSPLYTLDLIS